MNLALAVVLLALSAVLVFVAIDRTSRANAWRRIAEERRWNTEQHLMTGPAGGTAAPRGGSRHVQAGGDRQMAAGDPAAQPR
jgi:uncharacterized membrane protein YsdA (DUF1294 family)